MLNTDARKSSADDDSASDERQRMIDRRRAKFDQNRDAGKTRSAAGYARLWGAGEPAESDAQGAPLTAEEGSEAEDARAEMIKRQRDRYQNKGRSTASMTSMSQKLYPSNTTLGGKGK